MSSFVYYNTPPDQFQRHYGDAPSPFKTNEVSTQLPIRITVIRSLAAIAITSLSVLNWGVALFSWPVVLGVAFTAWTIHSHLISQDSLMKAFHDIAGGKEMFDRLPEIELAQRPNEKIFQAIDRIEWDGLGHALSKSKTLDGRTVIIVKGLRRNLEDSGLSSKSIFAFIERLEPEEMPRLFSNLSERTVSVLHALLAPHKGNNFGSWISSRSSNTSSYSCNVYSSISREMAHELLAQVSPSGS